VNEPPEGFCNLNNCINAMLPSHKGSIHLFRFLGIAVYLHWSWFLVAVIQISYRAQRYSSYVWCVFEYLALFAIVLMHEFGHALACRSVGGRADLIVLWPLGGVAFVDPPPRPGATLWSLVAGPLVNVLLVPILSVGWFLAVKENLRHTMPNFYEFVSTLCLINLGLLAFNLLPIYPLDGGQILRSLLWYVVGRARSLLIASTIGMIAVGLLLLFAIRTPWLGVMAAFALIQCWSGLQHARQLARIEAAPRHAGLACPTCGQAPPVGNFWICGQCRRPFDMFGNQGICPHCGVSFNGARCMECGQLHPIHSFIHADLI
jgi:Zn-dependent protease